MKKRYFLSLLSIGILLISDNKVLGNTDGTQKRLTRSSEGVKNHQQLDYQYGRADKSARWVDDIDGNATYKNDNIYYENSDEYRKKIEDEKKASFIEKVVNKIKDSNEYAEEQFDKVKNYAKDKVADVGQLFFNCPNSLNSSSLSELIEAGDIEAANKLGGCVHASNDYEFLSLFHNKNCRTSHNPLINLKDEEARENLCHQVKEKIVGTDHDRDLSRMESTYNSIEPGQRGRLDMEYNTEESRKAYIDAQFDKVFADKLDIIKTAINQKFEQIIGNDSRMYDVAEFAKAQYEKYIHALKENVANAITSGTETVKNVRRRSEEIYKEFEPYFLRSMRDSLTQHLGFSSEVAEEGASFAVVLNTQDNQAMTNQIFNEIQGIQVEDIQVQEKNIQTEEKESFLKKLKNFTTGWYGY